MEWIIFCSLIAVAILGIFIKAMYDDNEKHKKFLKELVSNYGKQPSREYEYDEFQNITHYFEMRKKQSDYQIIDDVTWHDLDMDHIFMLVNHTWSSAGQEYLYDMLRKPQHDKKILEERNRIIEFFADHEDIRVSFQDFFHKIGRTQKISFSDYLRNLKSLEEESNTLHYFCWAFASIAFAMIFFAPAWGFVLFIAAMCFNITTYFRRKGQIDPYIISFSYLMRMMKNAEKMMQMDVTPLEPYYKELRDALKNFQSFKRNSYVLMSNQRMSGNLAEIPLDYLRMTFHLDLVKFNSMLKIVKKNEVHIETILRILGFLDAAIAVGAFRKSLNYYALPTLEEDFKDGTGIEISQLYHPLISNPVASDISTRKGILLTGSNASGKSTFLKAVAISSLLSQTIYTATARSYKGNFFRIYSSMALADNIFAGESYYMVEIKTLKRIVDAAKEELPILCFVDEVLRGTNTAERIAASSQILNSFCSRHVICFAATHDIELTHILEGQYDNYHFTEVVEGNDIVFPYCLYKGRAESRNAIKLLSIIGYDEEITRKAEETCEKFIEHGIWEKL